MHRTRSLTAPSALLFGSLAVTGTVLIGAASRTPADEPVLALMRVVETRTSDVSVPDAGEDMMFMSSQQPGLRLLFSLKLPKGVHVMSLQQPAKVVATDSAGTDLSKIEPGFRDELEYVDLEHDFKDDDDLNQITLQLATSARKAETFDVSAPFTATVFTGTKPVPVTLTGEWIPLPADIADIKDKMRIKAADDGIAIEPSSLETWLEKIEIQIADDQVVESNGWFSDGATITYMFDELPKERPLKATVTVRTGVKTLPLTIDLKKQALP